MKNEDDYKTGWDDSDDKQGNREKMFWRRSPKLQGTTKLAEQTPCGLKLQSRVCSQYSQSLMYNSHKPAPQKRAERDSDADTAKRDVLPRKTGRMRQDRFQLAA